MGKKIEKDEWLEIQFSKFRELDNCENPAKTLTKRLKNYQKQTKSQYYRFWEILKDCELHMTNFKKFNDIDEGRYSFYSSHTDPQEIELMCQKMKDMKKDKNICAFADLKRLENNENNLSLMWAHYGGSHYGIRIDFRINPNYEGDIYKIDYNIHDKTYNINKLLLSTENTDSEIINILTTKKTLLQIRMRIQSH